MKAEQFEGKWSQFKGEAKRQWGKLADVDMTEAGGELRQVRRARAGALRRQERRRDEVDQ